MAEGVGFEPTRELAPPGGFQDRCLKPLGHPSVALSLMRPGRERRKCPMCTPRTAVEPRTIYHVRANGVPLPRIWRYFARLCGIGVGCAGKSAHPGRCNRLDSSAGGPDADAC